MTSIDSHTTVFGNKKWTEREKSHLAIAYKMGASLKLTSQLLNRSITSINKALTRYGIRNDLGNRVDTQGDIRKPEPTYEEVLSRIRLWDETQSLEPEEDQELKETDPVNRIKVPTFIRQNKHKARGRQALQTEILVRFKQFIEAAKRLGIRIETIKNKQLNKLGYAYLVNGKPVTLWQILMQVNQIRRDAKLPVMWVKGITVE